VAISAPKPEASGKVPPQNLEAETSVLGSILLSDAALDPLLIDVKLRPEDFYSERHGLIFQAMIRLKEKADPEPVDVLTVSEQLSRENVLDEAGGTAYVHSLPNLVPAAGNVRHYARIVKQHSMLRRLLRTTRDIQDEVFSFQGEPHELIELAESRIYHISHDDRTGELRRIEDILHDELDKLEQVSREGVSLTGTPSGFKDLDELTGGFQPGNLIVLAARPAMGKSSLVVNIAENSAVTHGRGVALFSLEMSETELAQRFIASQAKLNGDDLRKGRIKTDRWPKVVAATEKLAASPLYVDDSSDMGVLELRAKARRLHSRNELGLVVVDYLQLLRPEAGIDSRVEQIGQISRGLKLLARELHVPVIAVSQLSRAVESRPDKRPLLSDLRESGCLTGDTRVFLADSGGYVPIAELAGCDDVTVLAIDESTWTLEPRRARGFATGRKAVYRLRTQLGRSIRATANHKFLTLHGWRRLDELDDSAMIALPRRLPCAAAADMPPAELALLGHLIGDGCALPRHAIQYTTKERDLAETVAALATDVFGDSIRPRVRQARTWFQVYLAAAERLTHRRRNPIAAWLDELGIFGLRSPDKRVPDRVFAQPAESIAVFLRHLWATDGCVYVGDDGRRHRIYYATSSRRLARDVQSLLLRLGINARIGAASQGDRGRVQHHVEISGREDQQRFLEHVGAVGARRSKATRALLARITARDGNTNRDVIPRAAWREIVEPARVASGLTTRAMQRDLGMSYCGSTLYTTNISRPRAERLAAVADSDMLRALATSDVYWDRVVAVDFDGEEDVYDLEVEGLHNFVADDIVVHNSIEQDADLVMFIYRDEYYNKESERPGEADLIIAKHRNGPIGEVVLTFMARYPKFATIYRDPAYGGHEVGTGRGGDLPPGNYGLPPGNGGAP